MSGHGTSKERQETEVKLPVHDAEKIRRKLRRLDFRLLKPRHFEANHLYDFPDQRLRLSHSLLRLRFDSGDGLLTYKGAPLDSKNYKVRREVETLVADGQQLKTILESLGFREGFYYEKYRTVYVPREKRRRLGPPSLVFDETPIGDFLELEGPERWIDSTARKLGYTRADYITHSYAALYFQRCLERGEKPGDMRFPPRNS